jgi:arylsulfatase A-like enzyme
MKPIIQSVETQNISNYRKRLIKQSARFSGDVESPLYDDRFRIPLLFVGPNIPSGKIISSQVRSIDIFPTIAELIGIPYEKNIDGQSLLPILNGEKYDIPAFLDGAVNAPKFISKEWIGIRLPAYKYFRLKNNSKNDSYLFDLKNDPNEEHNIASKNMDIVTKMEDILVKYLSGHNFKHEEIHESSDEEAKRVEKELHKLGYV